MKTGTTFVATLLALTSFPLLAQQPSPASQPPPGSQAASPAAPSAEMSPVNGELVSKLDSKTAKPGDSVVVQTRSSAKTADGIEIPKGSKLMGRVLGVRASGAGENSQVVLQFDHLELKGGQSVPVHSQIQSISPTRARHRPATPPRWRAAHRQPPPPARTRMAPLEARRVARRKARAEKPGPLRQQTAHRLREPSWPEQETSPFAPHRFPAYWWRITRRGNRIRGWPKPPASCWAQSRISSWKVARRWWWASPEQAGERSNRQHSLGSPSRSFYRGKGRSSGGHDLYLSNFPGTRKTPLSRSENVIWEKVS